MRVRHKYNATRTELDGIKFSSKREAGFYATLKLGVQQGTVVQFLRQVPFHLPGGSRYVCDFLVFYPDGTCAFIDVKGMETETFKLKKKMVEELYHPIKIETVR